MVGVLVLVEWCGWGLAVMSWWWWTGGGARLVVVDWLRLIVSGLVLEVD